MTTELKTEWREVLLRRSIKNRLEFAVNGTPSRWQTAIAELRKSGHIVWLDHLTVPALGERGPYPLLCDVYLLTPKGVELCEAHGIKKRKI